MTSDSIKVQKKLRSIYAKHKDSLTEDEKTAIILAERIISYYDRMVALCEPIIWEEKNE